MVKRLPGSSEPGLIKATPREIGTSAAAPRPTEREPGVIAFKGTKTGGELQSEKSGPGGIWPDERLSDLDCSRIEGWVAGVPVVDGVADSGWVGCEGGRVRFVVRVLDRPEQKEWVRAMSYGGAYAKEVLGQAA